MTTKVMISRAYNVETSIHQGVFPNCFWESERTPLYGCEGVEITTVIYPFGNTNASRGDVSVYINFYGISENLTLEVNFAITLYGIHQASRASPYPSTVTLSGDDWGWESYCKVDLIKDKEVAIEVSVTVQTILLKEGNRTTTTRPAGFRLYEIDGSYEC